MDQVTDVSRGAWLLPRVQAFGTVGGTVGVGHTPQLLWPEDHAWVVATGIDTASTIVAGPRRLIAEILADERFEAFEAFEVSEADGLV